MFNYGYSAYGNSERGFINSAILTSPVLIRTDPFITPVNITELRSNTSIPSKDATSQASDIS